MLYSDTFSTLSFALTEQKDSTSREAYDFVIIPDNKRIRLVFCY